MKFLPLTADRRQLVAATACMLCVAIAGCTQRDPWKDRRPKTIPASGEVIYRGQPVEGAIVTFVNAAAGRSARATTDAKGVFKLTTFETNDGAVPGMQVISIYKAELDFPGTKLAGLSQGELQAALNAMPAEEKFGLPPAESRWLIPSHYGATATSKLTAEVVEGGENHFRYELSD